MQQLLERPRRQPPNQASRVIPNLGLASYSESKKWQ